MARSRRSVWFKPIVAGVIALTITLVGFLGLSTDTFIGFQQSASDGLFPGTGANSRIVVIGIDDRSIALVGRWPWSRATHADLIDALGADGAQVIGYDVTFGSPSREDPESDELLADSIAAAGNVVLAESVTFEGRHRGVPADPDPRRSGDRRRPRQHPSRPRQRGARPAPGGGGA
jgi:CHASE2 domain-containing sensor protein